MKIVFHFFTLILVFTAFNNPRVKAQNATGDYEILVSLDSVNFPTVHLGEVIIKSARGKRSLQELPISTSLVPAAQVETEQINGLTDLTTRVPNLYMPSYGSKLTSPIYIRGIGSRINSPAVGLYVDHIPQFDKSSFDFEFFDIERVEILRGPQGTLYGRNNMGGLIHVFTLSPENNRGVAAEAGFGNYGLQNYQLLINRPLSKKSDIQLSGQMKHRDGYFKNYYSGKMADQLDVYNGRLRLVHRWRENIKSDLIISHEKSDQNGYPYGVINPKNGKLQRVNYNEPSSYSRDLTTAGLVNSFRLGEVKLHAITSAQYIDDEQVIDQDFTAFEPSVKPQYLVVQPQTQHIFSQEITATLQKNEIETVIGVFGFLHQMDKNVRVYRDTGGDYPSITRKNYDYGNSGIAIFTQTTISNFLFKNLSFTSGIRVDWEKATQDYYHDMDMNGTIIPRDSADAEMTFSEALPRLTFDYRIGNKANVFASLTKGYKTGGFNTSFDPGQPQDQTFEAEHSWNYEIGIKTKWLFRMLRFGVTGFYIDWQNQQIYQPVPSGQGSMLTNAGSSESKGFETEFTFRPVPLLETNVNIGYTHAVFNEYQKDSTLNLSGNLLPYAPRTTIHVGQNINIPVKKRWLETAIVNLNYQGIGKLYWNDENSASQDYYGQLNGSVTLLTKGIELSFWAKNITDTGYRVFQFSALGNKYAQQGIPAIFGTRLKMTF